MICSKCKTKNFSSARVCVKCGNELKEQSPGRPGETGFHLLKCPNCSAMMDIDAEKRMSVCSYCGTRQMLKDSDAVEIERLRVQTHKEIELAKLEKQTAAKPKGRAGRNALVAATILLYMASMGMLSNGDVVLAIVSFIQASFFLGAWLMGRRADKIKKKQPLGTAFVILGLLMFIPFIFYNEEDKVRVLVWPDNELARMLPEPPSEYGYVTSGTALVLDATLDKVSGEAYDEYLKECKALGFTNVDESGRSRFEAYNEEGYFLKLFYFKDDKVLYVTLNAPPKFVELSWPPTELAKNIPQPHTLRGVIERLSSTSFVITIADSDLEAYNNYAMALFNMGYDRGYYEKGNIRLSTSDKHGNSVLLKYNVNDTMTIDYLQKK